MICTHGAPQILIPAFLTILMFAPLQKGGIIISRYVVRIMSDPTRRSQPQLCNPVLILLMLAPHFSWLYVLIDFHLLTMRQYFAFGIHLTITYTLTFCAFASLIVLIVRDPGSVAKSKSLHDTDSDLELTEALMQPRDHIGSWCHKCEV